MNILKIFGAIGAAALAAGGLIVAGRTGLGKSDDPDPVDEAPEAEGGEPEETEKSGKSGRFPWGSDPESDDDAADA